MSRERTSIRCERTYDQKLVWNADIYANDLTLHTQGATLEEAVEKLRARLRTFLGEGDLAK